MCDESVLAGHFTMHAGLAWRDPGIYCERLGDRTRMRVVNTNTNTILIRARCTRECDVPRVICRKCVYTRHIWELLFFWASSVGFSNDIK